MISMSRLTWTRIYIRTCSCSPGTQFQNEKHAHCRPLAVVRMQSKLDTRAGVLRSHPSALGPMPHLAAATLPFDLQKITKKHRCFV